MKIKAFVVAAVAAFCAQAALAQSVPVQKLDAALQATLWRRLQSGLQVVFQAARIPARKDMLGCEMRSRLVHRGPVGCVEEPGGMGPCAHVDRFARRALGEGPIGGAEVVADPG